MSDVKIEELQIGGVIRSDDFRDVYANQIRLGVTLSDFTIVFGVSDDQGRQTLIKDVAAVRLSPGTVKLLLTQMSAVMSAYEEACGVVPSHAVDKTLETAMLTGLKQNLHQTLTGKSPGRVSKGEPS